MVLKETSGNTKSDNNVSTVLKRRTRERARSRLKGNARIPRKEGTGYRVDVFPTVFEYYSQFTRKQETAGEVVENIPNSVKNIETRLVFFKYWMNAKAETSYKGESRLSEPNSSAPLDY